MYLHIVGNSSPFTVILNLVVFDVNLIFDMFIANLTSRLLLLSWFSISSNSVAVEEKTRQCRQRSVGLLTTHHGFQQSNSDPFSICKSLNLKF